MKITAKMKTTEQYFWEKVKKTLFGCWEWQAGCFDSGYGAFHIPSKKMVRAHRFSWELHFGPIPEGMKVLHDCDNKRCIRPSHLWLGTNADNSKDMVNKKRQAFGTQHGRVKLTDGIVLKAREQAKVIPISFLAKKYNVSCQTMWEAVRGKTWKHLQCD